jgi:hypothetical protein
MKEEPIILLCIFNQNLDLLELDRTRDLVDARPGSMLRRTILSLVGWSSGMAWIVVVDKNHNITR